MTGVAKDRRIDVYTHQVRLVVAGYDLGLVDLDFSFEIDSHWTDNLLGGIRFSTFWSSPSVSERHQRRTSPGWSYLSVNR